VKTIEKVEQKNQAYTHKPTYHC